MSTFRWTPDGLVPVRVVRSVRIPGPVRLVPPAPVKALANVVGTPVYDRLAWERGGDPLCPLGSRPTAADVVAGLVAAGAR